jgi:hypothetical protein
MSEDMFADLVVADEDIIRLYDWWDMPSMTMRDCRSTSSIKVDFWSEEDRKDFIELIKRAGARIHPMGAQYPAQDHVSCYYDGPKVSSRHPICIPSKGRWDHQTTGKRLDEMGCEFLFFVEQHEAPAYISKLGESRVVSMPFSDLGQGSIPARNFIWDWAKENGHARHWVVDDNISGFYRLTENKKRIVKTGMFFRAMEDYVERFDNVALAAPHGECFVLSKSTSDSPVAYNSRCYSCTLVDTQIPFRWRGKYNEDTDLSLRVLKAGYCTILFRAMLMKKKMTARGCFAKDADNQSATPGGNTANVYTGGDLRRSFAESLQQQHPDLVKVVWKFNRWHHEVDYSPFKSRRPTLKKGVNKGKSFFDYGMVKVRYRGEPEELEPSTDEEIAEQDGYEVASQGLPDDVSPLSNRPETREAFEAGKARAKERAAAS